MDTALKATALVCTLKPSPFDSSSDLIAAQVLDELGRHGVEGEAIRVVDHDIRPGVEADMGDGDGAHKIIADSHQALNDIGFTIPAQGSTYWNSEAMNPQDFKDLEVTPTAVVTTTKTLAANAAHLGSLLAHQQYPAV